MKCAHYKQRKDYCIHIASEDAYVFKEKNYFLLLLSLFREILLLILFTGEIFLYTRKGGAFPAGLSTNDLYLACAVSGKIEQKAGLDYVERELDTGQVVHGKFEVATLIRQRLQNTDCIL